MREDIGEFGPLFDWPLIGIHTIITPNNMVLTFGSDRQGLQGGNMYYDVWNPVTNVHHTLTNITEVDMFCAVALVLPTTGNIMIAGGDARPLGMKNYGITSVLQYNYRDESLFKAPEGDMVYARWYPTAVTLTNGSILVLGGRGNGSHGTMADSPYPELYTPGVGWKTMVGASDQLLQTNWYYPRAWLASDGEVVVLGRTVRSIDTTGDGAMQAIGTLPFAQSNLMPMIMFGEDKVLALLPTGVLKEVDFSDGRVTQRTVGDLGETRFWSNMVILADGKVMISGGSGQSNKLVNVTNQVAIWDPVTHEITLGDTAGVARLYHSTTILMPNASVLSLGGGAPGPLVNLNGEIYKPGYLFNGDAQAARPVITSAPGTISAFGTFQITLDDTSDLDRLTFVKNGAVTHAFNMDARFIELPFNVNPNGTVTVNPPDNANILTPGNWMLFAIDDEGTPSVARKMKVTVTGQVQVAAADGFATLSGNAKEADGGAYKLEAAEGGNRGAIQFNTPIDLTRNAGFALEMKLEYCDCGDGLTFLLHSNSFGVQAPAATIDAGGLRLEMGKLKDAPGHELATGDHAAAAGLAAAADDHHDDDDDDDGGIPGDPIDPDPGHHDANWRFSKTGKAQLAEDEWHRVEVTWDAKTQSLSYAVDGHFAATITGDVLDAFLGGRTLATLGFVGGEYEGVAEGHEVRLLEKTIGEKADQVIGGHMFGDLLNGGAGNDTLYGGPGADLLRGLDGDDVLIAGRDGDQIAGGAGDDTFMFRTSREPGSGRESDVILDFGDGRDRIDLSNIDADRKVKGDQAFDWLGTGGFNHERGTLRFDGHTIYGDIDGDGTADFSIELVGTHALGVSDFVL